MALRYLSNEEMVALSTPWTTTDHEDRAILAGRPVLASLLPELDAAHHGVLNIRSFQPIQARLEEIQGEQQTVDRRHDELVRVIHHRFLSEQRLADLAGDTDRVERLVHVHSLLLPEGLSATRKAYREEAGHGQRVDAQLTDDHRALLTRLRTHDGTMLDCVTEWIALARQLGELDHERTGILPLRGGSSRADNVRARQRWMRIITLIRLTAELLGEDAEVAELLGRIVTAEEQKQLRLSRSDSDGEGQDEADEANELDDGDPDGQETGLNGNEDDEPGALVGRSEAVDHDDGAAVARV